MKVLALILLIAMYLPAQRGSSRPAPQAPQFKPEDACVVEGRVSNALTGEPLNKVAVRLLRTESSRDSAPGPRGYSVNTDGSGKFVFNGVVPGRYRLSAARNGFVENEYGARDPQRAGTTFSLSPKQRLGDLMVQLTPHGVVAGRVLDEDGEPLAGFTVRAMRYRYSQARKMLVAFGDGSTNDLGEYRIYGLPPGRYLIAVAPRGGYGPDRTQQPEEQYVATYFPSVTDPAAAAPVEIHPGTQLRGMDVAISRRRVFRVRGRVTEASGAGLGRVMIALRPRGAAGFSSSSRPSGVDSNGNFEIAGVAPGAYNLTAMLPSRGGSTSARIPVDVSSGNVENLNLVLTPGITVAGRVAVDGQAPATLAGMQVAVRAREPQMFGSSPNAVVQPDGAFSLVNVSPDQYDITVSGVPDGYYLKAITANGQDVLLSGVDLGRPLAGALDVVLRPNAGQAAGLVQNEQQEPAAGVTVVLIPQEKERKGLPGFYKTATTDSAGRFSIRNLEPGQYKAFAWREVEPGAYYDPDFMQPVENNGESLSIREGSQEDIKVRLIR